MRVLLPVALLLIAPLASLAAPVTIFTDFGTGRSYDGTTGYSLGGSNNDYSQAAAFTPAISSYLYQIDLPLSYVIASNAIVWLAADSVVNGVHTPGIVLEQFTITGIGNTTRIKTALSVTHPLISAGTMYWLAATDTAGYDGRLFWAFSLSSSGLVDTRYGSSPWDAPSARTLPAFDILGEPSPEPASAALLALGIFALAVRRTRAHTSIC